MRSDCAYGVICKLSPDCPNSGCGLECFMDMIKEDMEKFTNPKDQTLMHNLGNKYLQTWNARKTSKARGAATGRSFESWITNHLVSNGISYERGTMKFKFGTFQVDAIIPSREKPRVFLEIKINSDRQQALMFSGLINQLIDKDVKIGYVILYEPPRDVKNILTVWKRKYSQTFDFFHIENNWSKSIMDIISFCT